VTSSQDRVEWLTDLVRAEILLWDRVDEALRREHGVPLAFFETLFMISRAPGAALRIGELAQRLRITVGATSKLADRIEATGHIRRAADPADRRVSRLVLTPAGTATLAAATETYAAALADTVDPVLSETEQQQLHGLIRRLTGTRTLV
jgi:DNA-binding MarR family transcriptional regulator